MSNHDEYTEHYRKTIPAMRAMKHLRDSVPSHLESSLTVDIGPYEMVITHSWLESAVELNAFQPGGERITLYSISNRGVRPGISRFQLYHRCDDMITKLFVQHPPTEETLLYCTGAIDSHRTPCTTRLLCSEEEYFQKSTVDDVPEFRDYQFAVDVGEMYNFMEHDTAMRVVMNHSYWMLHDTNEFDIINESIWGFVNQIILFSRRSNISNEA